MSFSESEIIQRYFNVPLAESSFTTLGIGDDAALLTVPEGYELATSIDSFNEGVHFPKTTSAFDIGHKSLAVSLSYMAAMGARPSSALLALSLPAVDLDWLDGFSAGFLQLAKRFNLDLVGGDLCRGPLSVTTVVNGLVPKGQALRRSRAQPGDLIYVTGTLGDAGLALELLQQKTVDVDSFLLTRLNRPEPRVQQGLALLGVATSAMDLSDGLLTDLARLCQMSQVGAVIQVDALPLSENLRSQCALDAAYRYALSSGDDYELVFTVPKGSHLPAMMMASCVGEIVVGSSVKVVDAFGQEIVLNRSGFDHFKNYSAS